jgi:pimeloyl-ACP methyl ester carboxylesterase
MTIELNYVRKGAGEPVVLMHGIGHRWQAFEPIVDLLAEKYDVIAVDAAGFADSPSLPKGTKYSVNALADALTSNFALWGIEKPHVVGNSMGGEMAIVLGQTGRARSVTALSPSGYFGPFSLLAVGLPLFNLKIGAYLPKWFLKSFSTFAVGRFYIGAALFRHPLQHSSEDVYLDSLAMKKARGFWPMVWAFIKEGVKRPKVITGRAAVPTTFAWAEHDLLLWGYQGRRAERLLAGSRLVTIADAGHVSMPDNPEAVVAAIESTIAQTHVGDRLH